MIRAAASMRLWARAMPTLLRVGAAEAFAYRVEFIVWMFTNTMPLIMLGLWSTVAHEGPFMGFGQSEFVAYYLAAMIVRTVTGSWVVWQINDEIRTGTLSMRLLRPIHPFVAYSGVHLSAIPLRSAIALPIAVVLLLTAGRGHIETDPVIVAVFLVSLIGAWALTYFAMIIIGALSFWVERSIALFDMYLGVVAVFSGYLIPLSLLPDWMQTAAGAMPFKYMLGYPVELITGHYDRAAALEQLAVQWGFVALLVVTATLLWRAGVRRYEAYGA